MINRASPDHLPALTEQLLAVPLASASRGRRRHRAQAADRLEDLVRAHFESAWRFVRRLGIPEHDVDDVMQEVILVVARKLESISVGSEHAFVMSTAYRVASDLRRARGRRSAVDVDDLRELADALPGPDALTDQHRARRLLEQVLETMPIELRAVFVLYELEGSTMAEIAETLSLAPGTVASRLRRARELFEARVTRIEQRIGKGDAT